MTFKFVYFYGNQCLLLQMREYEYAATYSHKDFSLVESLDSVYIDLQDHTLHQHENMHNTVSTQSHNTHNTAHCQNI